MENIKNGDPAQTRAPVSLSMDKNSGAGGGESKAENCFWGPNVFIMTALKLD